MYASVLSVALVGGGARVVHVEAHVGGSTNVFKLSGLPDTALREAKDRVKAAVNSSEIDFPRRELTVNLAPADLKKRGSDYDVAIALCVLAASGEIGRLPKMVVAGELALDGKIRSGGSALGAAVLSARLGIPAMVAHSQAPAVARVPGSRVFAAGTLAEAVSIVASGFAIIDPIRPADGDVVDADVPDLSDVRGQAVARRAVEIAAAGGHHLLLHGPPGGGKTMLAHRMRGILPQLDDEAAIEVALIRSNAGLGDSVSSVPPIRAPHHSATRAALVGGGTGIPTPGEISLAHRGVLFLDELAEFPRGHLDALRQPLEEGRVVIARQGASMTFPARFQLIAATNPCPCGYWGDHRRPCTCPTSVRERYRTRVSGPLFDRFDLAVAVPRVEADEYRDGPGETSSEVSERIARARSAQDGRGRLNVELPVHGLSQAPCSKSARALLMLSLERGTITARGAGRVLRVARTIADLDDAPVEIAEEHLAEALSLRGIW